MNCPSCSCSEKFQVKIGSKEYLECTFCGNLWSPRNSEENSIRMNCTHCGDKKVTAFRGTIENYPKIICSDCKRQLIPEKNIV